jgi:hypothetical protein
VKATNAIGSIATTPMQLLAFKEPKKRTEAMVKLLDELFDAYD